MRLFQWTPDLAVGMGKVDEQHKDLFGHVNNLLVAVDADGGKDEVRRLLDFLADYVNKHFADEEAFMKRFQYPRVLQHLRQHDEFRRRIVTLRDLVEKGTPSKMLVLSVQGQVCDWLVEHVSKVDKQVGEYVRDR
ncbi:MAG: bacteriohemerythrin [Dehalococcoidales bacterium]|nr:bacteriohemerythrin [Dehalococcoidales bacterium]